MPRFNTEEQFKFLISCIRYSNNGRIDFGEVAKECSICSKGAAAKRYERMMKAHSIGFDMSAADGSTDEPIEPPKKKRKRAQAESQETDNESGQTDPEKVSMSGEIDDMTSTDVKSEATHSSNFLLGSLEALDDIDDDLPLLGYANGTTSVGTMTQNQGPCIKEEPQ